MFLRRSFKREMCLMMRILLKCLLTVAVFRGSSGQSTTTVPSTSPAFLAGGGTTTASSTSTSELGGTTLTAADSSAPTTTVANESEDLEATTEGQESFNRFESARTKPFANQEATTPTPNGNSGGQSNDKSREKNIAWKFGRGGSGQDGWSIGPTANNGHPLWKKEAPLPGGGSLPNAGQTSDTNGKKNNDQQAYIVWSVGQGTPPNGWSLSGGQDGWANGAALPANSGWNQGDGSEDGNTGGDASWNAGEWTDDQPSDDEDSQGGWTEDEGTPEGNPGGGWTNTAPVGWNAPNGNTAVWTNDSPPPVAGNVPPPGWTPQGDGPAGGWDDGSGGQVVNNGGGGWLPPQPVQQNSGSGWAPQGNQAIGGTPPNGAQGGWTPPNGGGWTKAQPQNVGSVTWDTAAPVGGWSNGQQNSEGWNSGPPGGAQDPDLSWKVYNEDTHTMENLDDNSGWKVVGDGGPDGWKLVNENGNIEWKIENVNGEWKVVSADDLPPQDNSTTPSNEDTNTTTVSTNVTTDASVTTTPTPSWDDTKQGRYIVWKFSENGKGEARVYSGDGAEPVVWTVGDNQYWKETIGLNPSNNNSNNNGKATWAPNSGTYTNLDTTNTAGNNDWNGNNGNWQNTAKKPNSGSWQNAGNNIPSQNSGWQADGGDYSSQLPNTAWKNSGQPAPTTGNWQAGGPSPASPPNWQTGGQNAPQSNKWQSGSPVAPTNTNWQNGNPAAPTSSNWQNGNPAAPTSSNWQNGNPAAPTSSKWQGGGSAPPESASVTPQLPNVRGWQAGGGTQQNGWKNKVVIVPQTNSWTNTAPVPQQNGGWQNQQPTVNNGWDGGNKSPPTSGGWQSTGPTNQTPSPQVGWQNGGPSPQSNSGWAPRGNGRKNQGKGRGKNQSKRVRASNGWQPNKSNNNNMKNNARGTWNSKNGGPSWNQGAPVTTQASWNSAIVPSAAPPPANSNGGVISNWQNAGNAGSTGGWSSGGPQIAPGQNGQTVPYIIVIKQPDGTAVSGVTNSWSINGNNGNTKKPKNRNSNKPKNGRRGGGWKMNPAGSSGWQWNPQGGSGGWKWTDGWMGSGGGFGGWMSDKGTMYSGWRPTKTNAASPNTQPNSNAGGGTKANKKNGGKMVFVFGTKRNSAGGGQKPNTNGRKKGKQVIILDYTDGKTKGEDGMKKDIESVIQALRTAKLAGPQSTAVWKRGVQSQNQQQWGR